MQAPANHIRLAARWLSASAFGVAALVSAYAQATNPLPRSVLGTPPNGTTISGVGVISGYHCDATSDRAAKVEIRVDDVLLGPAGTGTTLLGTQAVCGRTDTGFSLLYNFNNLPEGEHTIVALLDGTPFAVNRIRTVRSTGVLWRSFGNSAPWTRIDDFPEPGKYTVLVWKDELQGFVVADSVDSRACVAPSLWHLDFLRCIFPVGVDVVPKTFKSSDDYYAFARADGVRYVASGAVDAKTQSTVVFTIYNVFVPAHSEFSGYVFPDEYWPRVGVMSTNPVQWIADVPFQLPTFDASATTVKGTARGLLIRQAGQPAECVEVALDDYWGKWEASPAACD